MNKYLLDKDKFNQFYELYLYSFNRPDSPQRRSVLKERFDHAIVYGIMNEDKLGSGLFSIPFNVNFHDVDFKMNGIGDVMSAPEFGGRGGASSLMNQALEDMYNDGVTLSYLAPFSYGYYRQFGFEQVFDHTRITIKNSELPRVKNTQEGIVKRVKITELPDSVKRLYLEKNHLGGMSRADWWWNHMVDKHPEYQLALAYQANKLIGYLVYYNEGVNFVIHEWVNSNPLSLQLLLKFVTKHQSIFENFIYESPDADFKADLLEDPNSAKLEVIPYMMARIVNLEDFLKRYPIQKMNLARINFKVEDSLAWNNHTWSLAINDGIVDLKVADELKPDLELTIQNLTKAMFGYRSLDSLVNYGLIKGDIEKISDLSSLFVQEKPQLIDYF